MDIKRDRVPIAILLAHSPRIDAKHQNLFMLSLRLSAPFSRTHSIAETNAAHHS